MSSARSWLLRQYGAKARAQGIEFERQRVAASVRDTRTEAEIARSIGAADPGGLFQCGDVSFDLNAPTSVKHGGALGKTGSGKTVATLNKLVRFARGSSAARRSREGFRRLGAEIRYVDIKDDVPRFKRMLAAWYVTAPAELQEALRHSVFLDQFTPGRVPVRPLVSGTAQMNEAHLATLRTDVLVAMSNDTYSDVVKLVVTSCDRLLAACGYHFDPFAVIEIIDNRAFREQLIERPGVPRDVRYLLGHLDRIAAPQQLEAAKRRMITAVPAHPQLAASMFQPRAFAPEARPITVVDCGPESLPRSLGLAHACSELIEFVLRALGRDPSDPCIAHYEELLSFLMSVPSAVPWFLDAWRLLRSRSTAVWWAAQSLDGLSRAFVEEVLNNMGWILAFASRSEVADLLFPHLAIDPSDRRSEEQRRRAFARDLESLPTQQGILWVKGSPAIRIRTATIAPPSAQAGLPDDELDGIFDEVLAGGSTVSLDLAERRIEEWRATHLPRRTAPRAERPRPSARDLFADEEDA